jgi:hypothetical protein
MGKLTPKGVSPPRRRSYRGGHGAQGRRIAEDGMLIADARVETERSSRYLVQLCQHLNTVGQAHPEMQVHVEWSGERAVISFDWGRCTLHAEPRVLTLRAEAPDEGSLLRLEQRLTDRLELIGRRDQLTVTWTPTQRAAARSADAVTSAKTERAHLDDPNRGEGAHG